MRTSGDGCECRVVCVCGCARVGSAGVPLGVRVLVA